MNPSTLVSRNPLGFWLFKQRYYGRYRKEAGQSAGKHQPILDQLVRDGVVVLPGYFPVPMMERIRAEIADPLSRIREGTYTGPNRFHRFPEYGVYRLLQADRIAPSSLPFFEDEMINTIASHYVGPKVKSYQRQAESRPDVGRFSLSDFYHFDDWRHRFKAFLYLTDVGPDQAPFGYLKGTHNNGAWRFSKEWEYHKLGRNGPYGHYFPQETDALKKKYGFEDLTCTAGAGTLILADTRGIHKGTTLRNGERLTLANFFDVRPDPVD